MPCQQGYPYFHPPPKPTQVSSVNTPRVAHSFIHCQQVAQLRPSQWTPPTPRQHTRRCTVHILLRFTSTRKGHSSCTNVARCSIDRNNTHAIQCTLWQLTLLTSTAAGPSSRLIAPHAPYQAPYHACDRVASGLPASGHHPLRANTQAAAPYMFFRASNQHRKGTPEQPIKPAVAAADTTRTQNNARCGS
jgi:hypothetical protein